jgi:hypothetical protein
VETPVIAPPSKAVELSAKMGKRPEPYSPHEPLEEVSAELLELPTSSRIVGPPVDHLNTVLLAKPSKLFRDEGAPVVNIDRLRLPSELERPSQVVDSFPGALPPIGAGHAQETGAVVQDSVDVDLPPLPGDAEVVDIGLSERVYLLPLEPLDGLKLLNPMHHEPVTPQRVVNCDPCDRHLPPREDRADPEGAP